jgi:hypothetical protein
MTANYDDGDEWGGDSGFTQLDSQRTGKLGRYCAYENDPQPDYVERQGCEFECPRCSAWLHPTLLVSDQRGHIGTEHDVRCGCLDACETNEDRTAYLLEIEAIAGEFAAGPVYRNYGVRGAVGYDHGDRVRLK